jgi:hypothetical protein
MRLGPRNASTRMSWKSTSFSNRHISTRATSAEVGDPKTLTLAIAASSMANWNSSGVEWIGDVFVCVTCLLQCVLIYLQKRGIQNSLLRDR